MHVRLLFVVVRDENLGPILENPRRLLIPGEYIRWDELAVSQYFIIQTGENLKAPLMERRLGLIKAVRLWVGELRKWITESGFGDFREWEAEEWEELARAFFDNHLAKDRDMVEEKGGEEGEEGLRGVEGLFEESRGGAVTFTPKVI